MALSSSGFSKVLGFSHRLLGSSFFWGISVYRILNINHKKELLWSLWVGLGFQVWLLLLSGLAMRASALVFCWVRFKGLGMFRA